MITTINLICHICKKSFIKSKSEYDRQIKKGRNIFFCSLNCNGTNSCIKIKNENIKKYLTNPKKCLKCNEIISYNKRFNKYCSHKCASIHCQKNEPNRKWSNKEKIKLSDKLKEYYILYPKRKKEKINRVCKSCNKILTFKRKRICEECKFNYYSYYRPNCEFDFNIFEHPKKFDLTLVKKHGIYSPVNKKNNLMGVSRDHLYSINDGFKNKIEPEIIKHPANCMLVLNVENQRKHSKSIISLEELKNRIEDWNKNV